MKIAIIGSGFQGVAEYTLLSGESMNEVVVIETEPTDAVKTASSAKEALKDAEIVFVSVPVPYDIELNRYDTNNLDMYISKILEYADSPLVVLRSDVPVGYTKRMKQRYPELRIMFVPNFCRELQAVDDTINPSRLVIGGGTEDEQKLVYELLSGASATSDGRVDSECRDDCDGAECGTGSAKSVKCPVVFTGTDEAESVKLFANSFLAMRVAYFNELDSYAELKGLNSFDIIKSVSLDPRIGDIYNNPSFGYGGRYLTESACRLKNDFVDLPEKLVDMVDVSNDSRKEHVVNMILKRGAKVCGVYGLGMKTGSKDFRYSAVEGVIKGLESKGMRVIIFEPMIKLSRYLSADVVNDFERFVAESDVIVANRLDERIKEYADKVYTRDLFERD